MMSEKPEEKARKIIDKQLSAVGWDIVSRDEYVPGYAMAVKEALMQGNTESDYLLFVDNKAIAVLEAKREENPLDDAVEKQAEGYAVHPKDWYGLWCNGFIPLVYMANGRKIYFKDMRKPDSEYAELKHMHSPKEMLRIIGETSVYGALPRLEKRGLRDCQYKAETELEKHLKMGHKRNLAVLATGSGKTYLACLASYRLLNYTPTRRVLFLVDRNNLARQTESEFSLFDRTEKQQPMSSLYRINRLKNENDINGDIVVSTIQKLFAVLTGQSISDTDEDEEDEKNILEEDNEKTPDITLGDHLKLPPDHFQFIIVDECHRSIYGKWRAVLEYFSGAVILGLTATPTPEAYAFFNNNIVENYTYDESVVDGVNVPNRIYRTVTQVTEHGGSINKGAKLTEKSKKTGQVTSVTADRQIEYAPNALDRSVINCEQIKEHLTAYKNAIYTDLYPNREKKWEYIPKTLIFAKDDNHATVIVEMVKEVFKVEFENEQVPEHFVQKITYSSGDSNALIRDFRNEKDFRIAVTVTLVATGTDVKPLEVVLFMKDVHSDVLYTQMKGRGCRFITDDKLKEVTPNADTKECYYIVDAVGVTESEKNIPSPKPGGGGNKTLSLEEVLEHLSHNDLSDENLLLLRNYCSAIHGRYENNPLFSRHLDAFIADFGFAPRTVADKIQKAVDEGRLEQYPYSSPSGDNTYRMSLIQDLIYNVNARKKLLEMQKGYIVQSDDADKLLYAGFSKETAKDFIDNFEKYINDNKDSIEALRILYNSEDTIITHTMLSELQDKLLTESRQFGVYMIWKNYQLLDTDGNVEELDIKSNFNALTNLIQLVRYAYGKSQKLTNILTGYAQRFALYTGQAQRSLTQEQVEIMKQIADYVINDGAIDISELNEVDTDLWRRAVNSLGAHELQAEMQSLSKFLLKVA